jgi:hypothetical protein
VSDRLPWEVRVTLRSGSVYYFVDRYLSSAEPHYFIVVNSRPLDQRVLILAVITSQVAKVNAWRRTLPGTTVEIAPSDYAELTKPSIVDCNVVFRKSLQELSEKITRGEIRAMRDVPPGILAALKRAIDNSPLVEEETKKLLR